MDLASRAQLQPLDDKCTLLPGQHFVEVAPDLGDLVEKLDHYMSHPKDASAIAAEGCRAWMDTLFVGSPYTLPNAIWERMVSQPGWRTFQDIFDVH